MIIEINGTKLEITSAYKISERVPLQDRAAYETVFGICVKIGKRGFFTYPSYSKYWFESKEDRDEVFDKVY